MPDNHRQIELLLYQYADRIDAGDLEGVAALFAHGELKAQAGSPGVTGHDAVLALYQHSTRLYPDNGTPHTKHVVSNVVIETSNCGLKATARSYFTVYQSLPDFPLQAIIAGRYNDEFEYVDGVWRFKIRRILAELFGDLSRHLLFDSSEIEGNQENTRPSPAISTNICGG